MAKIRVLLADDTKMMREGLRALLQSAGEIEVVAEATSGAEALRLARDLGPDVVVMDVRMPDVDGVQATRDLRAAGVGARVVAVSAALDDVIAGMLREAGVFAVVPKEDAFEKLVGAVEEAAAAGGDAPARNEPENKPSKSPAPRPATTGHDARPPRR